jgi:hypothetical protein
MYVNIIIVIIAVIITVILISDITRKNRAIEELKDIIDIMETSSMSAKRMTTLAIIQAKMGDQTNLDLNFVSSLVSDIAHRGRCYQRFGDVESMNNLSKYRNLGELNIELLEKLARQKELSVKKMNSLIQSSK